MSSGAEYTEVEQPFIDQLVQMGWKYTTGSLDHPTATGRESFREVLIRELDRRVTAHRQAVVSAVESWWSKYRETLRDIEGERDGAKAKLDGFLKELGYAE